MADLSDLVASLKGVGEKKSAIYRRLDIITVEDLLLHFPRSFLDYSIPSTISAAPEGELAVIFAALLVKEKPVRISGGRQIFKAVFEDEEGKKLFVSFFNNPYALMYANEGESYILRGKLAGSHAKREMLSPTFINSKDKLKLRPIYPLTSGLNSYAIAKDVATAYRAVSGKIHENLPLELRETYSLCHFDYALKTAHFPPSENELAVAMRRLAFEELLCLQLALKKIKSDKKEDTKIIIKESKQLDIFCKSLPFTLTGAQKKAIGDVSRDFASGKMMNRLIQGDVGSGKTVVAAAAAFLLAKNGYQTALMAPTEILAAQHLKTFEGFFKEHGIRTTILTGKMTAAEKKQARLAAESGQADIIIGTHALFSASTKFSKLGLVITDEQHRFGVNQRMLLAEKGERVHTMVMSATPIPRTLSLIIYGDLDLSVIDELPPGRKETETLIIEGKTRERAHAFIADYISKGKQAYIVCPLIEEGEEPSSELLSLEEYAMNLEKSPLAGKRITMLHGKMKSAEKTKIMADFSAGEIDVLLSTTVIEVGVDVKNAIVIMIENAERYGLSQLHQLRGRVGRGSEKAYCILVTDSKGQKSGARLQALKQSNDGFFLAEEDLKLRGPGDFFGKRQHGLPTLKAAEFLKDSLLLSESAEAAENIINKGKLKLPEYKSLRKKTQKLYEISLEQKLN